MDRGSGLRVSSTVEIQSHPAEARERRGVASDATYFCSAADLTGAHGPLAPQARAALRAQRGFAAAVRNTAQRVLAMHHGNRLLNLIVNDRGRFIVGLIALDLHFNRDASGVGLTPGRLRQRCAATGTCSPTRASALLAVMRLGDFVRAAASLHDRRRRELVPTARLVDAHRERWRCQFAASAPLLPAAAQALAALDAPHFVAAMARRMSAYYYAGVRVLDLVPPLRLFGERTGGMFAVLTLIAAADEAAIRDGAPISISVSELARRTGTSRPHVIKLVNDAVAQGLLRRDGQEIVLLPRLTDAVYDFFAIGYLFLAHCAEGARGEPGQGTVGRQAGVMPPARLAGETAAR